MVVRFVPMETRPPHPEAAAPTSTGGGVFLCAGEISGDLQAAHLARTMVARAPGLRVRGCGGERMRAAGVELELETAQLGYVGIQEAWRFSGSIRRAREQVLARLRADPPELVVLVDGERFNVGLTKMLSRAGIPFVYYFVPQVWFWGRWRTRGIARRAEMVIPAFPEERVIFEKKGARVGWYGHPSLDIVREAVERGGAPRPAGGGRRVALLPGSRCHEVERFSPMLLEAARRLASERPDLSFVLPVAAPHLEPRLRAEIERAGMVGAVELLPGGGCGALSDCDLVLLSSGTATLEAALQRLPMVVFYKVHPLTRIAAGLLLRTSHVAMPNILLGREVVPELLQRHFTVESLVAEAAELLDRPERVAELRGELGRIPELLGGGGALGRVAEAILALRGELRERASAMTPA